MGEMGIIMCIICIQSETICINLICLMKWVKYFFKFAMINMLIFRNEKGKPPGSEIAKENVGK